MNARLFASALPPRRPFLVRRPASHVQMRVLDYTVPPAPVELYDWQTDPQLTVDLPSAGVLTALDATLCVHQLDRHSDLRVRDASLKLRRYLLERGVL